MLCPQDVSSSVSGGPRMISRFGVRTALIAVAMMALAATAAAAAPPTKPRVLPGGASSSVATAAHEVLLPGDAQAAAARADTRSWLLSARAGAEAAAIARSFGARSIGSPQIGAFVVARDRARAFAGALRARGLLASASPNVLRRRAQAAPAPDPLTAQQWWRNAVVSPG